MLLFKPIYGPAAGRGVQEQELGRLLAYVELYSAFWDNEPYAQEMSFYREPDDVRRCLASPR